MPRAYPFDCTWADGAGNEQAGFAAGQWAASPIQLQCGRYDQLRTHLRLFRYGRFTLGDVDAFADEMERVIAKGLPA